MPPAHTIHDLPPQERPREKLAARGAHALTDSELLAILLRTGLPGANAVEIARQLLERYGSLGALSRSSVRELAAIKGIGPAKAVQLVAAFGLGVRLAHETFSQTPITEGSQVDALVGPEMRMLRVESVRVLLLDTRARLMQMEEITTGSHDTALFPMREILRPVLVYGAHAFIVVHNHPGGDPEPSNADIRATLLLRDSAELMHLRLADHVIIGRPGPNGEPGFTSLRARGILDPSYDA